ncbi:hypothetical protein FRC12_007095 [Ceratobasidium sp. 428]|nr:hypothetical protein FRC12_007095 [Ceratobasidium sp. 428]
MSRQNSIDDESLPHMPGGFGFSNRRSREAVNTGVQPAEPPLPPIDESTQSTVTFPTPDSPGLETGSNGE